MFDIFCKCPKCGGHFNVDFDSTMKSYYIEYRDLSAIYPATDPPKFPDYVIMHCLEVDCDYSSKMTHLEMLQMMAEYWSKLAWAQALSDHYNAYNFEDKSTRYISERGITNKYYTPTELEKNGLLKEFFTYIEKERTDESDD